MNGENFGENIKTLLENSCEPLVFNNLLKWKLLDWNIANWGECIGDTQLQFRMGEKSHSDEPQWEKTCKTFKGTFEDFRTFTQIAANNKWLYFDYKYLNQWLNDKHEIRNEINWTNFGYSNIKADDSTIWIGTEGAHTPCHIDTYGFNLIAQVTGRKLWLLFPPATDLKPTRIPYEQSTIYSSINFYSPPDNALPAGTICKRIILEPGQVLFVPNGWWHYVENLETAISINTWIPTHDAIRRSDEAITLMMVKLLTSGLKCEEQAAILNNPAELRELIVSDVFKFVETSMKRFKHDEPESNIVGDSPIEVEPVASLHFGELQQFFQRQSQRFPRSVRDRGDTATRTRSGGVQLPKKILSVLTDPEVIAVIKRKLGELQQ